VEDVKTITELVALGLVDPHRPYSAGWSLLHLLAFSHPKSSVQILTKFHFLLGFVFLFWVMGVFRRC